MTTLPNHELHLLFYRGRSMQTQTSIDIAAANSFALFADDLENLFSRTGLSIGPKQYDLIDEVTSRYVGPGSIPGFLVDASECVKGGRFIRGNSHRHAHGFTKLSLYRSRSTGFTIRLHIWWSGERASDDSPHEHRWSFYSRLLSGSLRIRNFAELPSGAGDQSALWHRYQYSDASSEGSKTVCADGVASLSVASEYVLHAGASHTLLHTEPHQVFGRSGAVAATLVVTAPPARDYSNVYHLQPNPDLAYSFGSARLDSGQVAEQILSYLRSVSPTT
jgi:hypothetical protein